MTKKDRQLIFDKYGGKCAYCGCELTKGWHIDEVEPCVRKYKIIPGHHIETLSGKHVWIKQSVKKDGYEHPERMNISNQFPACASCNIQKHSQSLESFRNQIKNFVNSLNLYHTQYKFAKRYGLVQETGIEVKFYFETI